LVPGFPVALFKVALFLREVQPLAQTGLLVEWFSQPPLALAVPLIRFPAGFNRRREEPIDGCEPIMIHSFPMAKIGRQITPRTATFDHIQGGIDNAPPIHWRTSTFGGFGRHRFEISPLGVGEVGLVSSGFYRPTGVTANKNCKNSQSNQAFYSFIWRLSWRKHPVRFQTHSNELSGKSRAALNTARPLSKLTK